MRQLNFAVLAICAVVMIAVSVNWLQAEKQGGKDALPHYSVVSTDAAHLIITNNRTDTLHFYTVGRDKEPGDDLHLRGSINLNRVGDAKIKVTKSAEASAKKK